jgi:hypothetical protein
MHTHAHIHTHTHARTHARARTHAHTRTCAHTCAHTHARTHTHTSRALKLLRRACRAQIAKYQQMPGCAGPWVRFLSEACSSGSGGCGGRGGGGGVGVRSRIRTQARGGGAAEHSTARPHLRHDHDDGDDDDPQVRDRDRELKRRAAGQLLRGELRLLRYHARIAGVIINGACTPRLSSSKYAACVFVCLVAFLFAFLLELSS